MKQAYYLYLICDKVDSQVRKLRVETHNKVGCQISYGIWKCLQSKVNLAVRRKVKEIIRRETEWETEWETE